MKTDSRGQASLKGISSGSLRRLFVVAVFMVMVSVPSLAFAITPPSTINPNVFFYQNQAPRVDGTTGALTQSIKLDLPPGRNGLQPNLSLDYNSQNTEQNSIVGYGWSLSIPYIERLNKTGSQDLYGSNPHFTSSMDGELIGVSTTTASSTTPTVAHTASGGTFCDPAGSASCSLNSYDNAGGNLLLCNITTVNEGTLTAPTYNGVSMTQIDVQTVSGSSQNVYAYYLKSPASGAHSVTVTSSATPNWYNISCDSFSGADTSSPIDSHAKGSGTSPVDITATTVANNVLGWEANFTYNGLQGTAASNGPGWTPGGSSADVAGNYYATSTVATGGSSLTIHLVRTGGSQLVAGVLVGIKPGSAATSTPAAATSYLPRIDQGPYHSYTYSTTTNSWTMFDKSGTEYFFGTTTQARQSATTTTSNVYKWMLEKVVDTNGNYISYTYAKDGNQIYPSQITYTGHSTTDGPMTVTFATTTRADSVDSYKTGFWVNTKYRISQITAAVNGTTVRQYNLSYTAANNGSRSLLSSIQKDGWNDSGTKTSEPAMTFGYMSSTTPFVGQGGDGTTCGNPWVAADANGDGINEQVTMYWDATLSQWKAKIAHADIGTYSTVSSPTNLMWAWSESSGPCPNETGTRFLDINGDGKGDTVYGNWNADTNSGTTGLYINQVSSTTDYSWTASTTGSGSSIPYFVWGGTTAGILGDVNGDGLPDFEQRIDGRSVGPNAYLANGSAWNPATTTIFSPAKTMPYGSADCTNSQLVDVNGDGLDDWVYSDTATTSVLINNGTGWNSTPDPAWTISTSTVYSSGGNCYDRGMRFVDINGDGLPDLVRGYNMSSSGAYPEKGTAQFAILNTGHGWAASTTSYAVPYVVSGDATATHYYDLATFFGNGQQNQDVLSTITYPKSGSTNVTYGYTTWSGNNPQLPYNLLVATNVVNHDGSGSNESTSHAYFGGQQYLPGNIFDRKFAGFASSTETNANGTIGTYYSQGATTTSLGDQADGYPQLGYPFRKDVFNASGTLVQKTFYRYDPYWHSSSVSVLLGRQLEENFASDGTHRDKDTDYTYSTSTNDLIEVDDYGEVTGASDGTFTDISGDSRTTLYSYAASSTVNMSVPVEKRVIDNSSATSTDAKYYYDGLSFGQVNVGNQTKQEDWLSGSTYASSTKTYNSYGLAATSTDRDGNATSYAYDTYNLYPATTTNALSQSTAYAYNYSNGKAKKTTDPNGAITQNLYDGLGRVTEVDQSNPNTPTSLLTKSTYAYTDSTTTPSLVHVSEYLNAATTTDTYDYYDGLGRLIQERKSTETAGTSAVTDSHYNTVGTLASRSLPYFSSGTSLTSSTSVATLYTTYAYDPLGRALTIANAVGTTTNSYPKWTTTATDPKGNVKDALLDAYGNLVQIVEHGSSIATTTYTYDAANNLTKITDAAGNVRNFTYDGLGRRLTAEDLHASGDGTFGSWSYAYDAAGNLTSQTDPKSQAVTRTYDALNRLLTESLTGTGVQITDTYDSCTNGIGRLCTASSTGAQNSYAYDVLGRTTGATTTISGTDYGLAYAYDRQGNVTSVTNNKNSSRVDYTYNTAGLVSAANRTSGGVSSPIASLFNFSPMNQAGQIVFGSNASTTYSYDATALYRLTNILTLGTSTTASSTSIVKAFLVAGGGGGGGNGSGGGGGGGGVFENDSLSIAPGTYTVTVGAGGASSSSTGNNGATSSISSLITATGGGGGGPATSGQSNAGKSGGSGGGSGSGTGGGNTGGAGITGQGHDGGSSPGGNQGAGGGGGAGAAGGAGDASNGGTGGNGLISSFTGSSVTYAGGGGSCNGGGSGCSSGGSGGGGAGASTGGNGSANTGGGGGGGNTGGAGGSGVVIIKYHTAQASAFTCGGTTTTTGADTVCTYTSTGTFTVASSSALQELKLQDVTYAYDADGNITTRTDNSNSGAGQQVSYSYDALNRLTSASTTVTNLGSYSQTFTYDVLGNLQTGPSGTYSYQGNTGSNYANPDAVTQIVLSTGASAPTIAYDNSTLAGNGTPASSLTFSHTTGSGSNGLIVVSVAEATTSPSCTGDTVTGVTYNGTSLNDLGYYVRETTNVKGALKTYYGFAPASGAHNVVVSASASCILYATATTYSGVKQSGMPDASGTGNPLSDSGAVSVFQATTTTSNINSWAVLVGVPSSAGTATAGSNTTIRQQQSGNLYYADSNSPISPAGARGLSWSTASSTHWLANYFSIPPTVSTPGSTATTTYTYDNNGNLTWVTAGATSTNYVYDYANRLTQTAIGASGATTTTSYTYDASGNRVSQSTGSVTTLYPSKYYSVVSLTGATTTATSTDYVFNGDTLLATIDQPMVNGTATGTALTRYNHPDNLGSTNVTSDENQNLAQWFDYAPYGSVVASTNTGTTTAARQYIGQVYDESSGLNYLNARYLQSSRGQFLSQDPTFLAVGNPAQLQGLIGRSQQSFLADPQSMNSYSYGRDNPITNKDPDGKYWDFSMQGTISPQPEFPGVSGAIGIRIDSHGVVGYVAPGIGWGYGGKPFTVSYTPGDIPRDGNVTSVVGTDAGPLGWSSNVLSGGNYSSPTTNYAIGAGIDVYVRKEFSAPIFGRGTNPGLPLVNTSNFSTPNYVSNFFTQPTIQGRTSAVSSFNLSTGASTPQSQLWTTPNGAVINWGGQVISAAPKK